MSIKSSSHIPRPSSRTAGALPVTEICEIACLVLCRIVVPKLARGLVLEG